MASHLHLRVCDHTTRFWRCVGTTLGHFSFGVSQCHGHGSWFVCEVALSDRIVWSCGVLEIGGSSKVQIQRVLCEFHACLEDSPNKLYSHYGTENGFRKENNHKCKLWPYSSLLRGRGFVALK